MHLLDTNVVSEIMRPRPAPRVLSWIRALPAAAISVVTLEELSFGLALKPNPRMDAVLQEFLAGGCAVLPVTDAIARRCGGMRAQLRREGQVRTQADLLIAATAAEHRLTLATRNAGDFSGCGVPVLDPFVG